MGKKVLSGLNIMDQYLKEKKIDDAELRKRYKILLMDYFSEIKKQLLKGFLWKPLYNWGVFGIIKRRGGGGINWGETNKQGKMIYYINDHSNGFHFKLVWGKDYPHIKVGFKNMQNYALKNLQRFKNNISNEIKSCAFDPLKKPFDVPKKV